MTRSRCPRPRPRVRRRRRRCRSRNAAAYPRRRAAFAFLYAACGLPTRALRISATYSVVPGTVEPMYSPHLFHVNDFQPAAHLHQSVLGEAGKSLKHRQSGPVRHPYEPKVWTCPHPISPLQAFQPPTAPHMEGVRFFVVLTDISRLQPALRRRTEGTPPGNSSRVQDPAGIRSLHGNCTSLRQSHDPLGRESHDRPETSHYANKSRTSRF